MKTKTGFFGVYPMLYAYFEGDGSVDLGAMRRQTEAAVAAGAHGVALLGLATEVNKLTPDERLAMVAEVATTLKKRIPLSVTIADNSVAGQIRSAREYVDAGADWVVLQPPPLRQIDERELIGFFGRVADSIDVPVGIQNAPKYLGIGLSDEALVTLHQAHPNISILKVEDTAVVVEKLVERVDDRFDGFVGRGGIELPDCVRAGAVGVIPGGEVPDRLAKVFRLLTEERKDAEAEAIYREVLPVLVFLGDSIEFLVTFGKELTALRLKLGPVTQRLPVAQSAFAREIIERYAAMLGDL